MTSRVLLADDHVIFREALGQLLEADDEIELIGEASDGREATALVGELEPDILLMDIEMPDLNGIEAARQILSEQPRLAIIILSMFSEPEQVIRALNAGVQGYVLKSGALDELMGAIRTVSGGDLYISPPLLRPIVEGYLAWAEQEGVSPLDKLTVRERQVLQLIAQGKSNPAIADELEVGVRTIESHRASLMTRLDIHNVADLVHFAIRHRLIPIKG
jgi:DNA-binding NarL/FixJ family response regulator